MKLKRILSTTIASLAIGSAAHAAAIDQWNSASGTWNTSLANWINGGTGIFANGDTVQFSTAPANLAITLGATVNPAAIQSNGTNTPATMTITGASGFALQLGTSGVAGTGSISDGAGLTTGYAGNLTYTAVGSAGTSAFAIPAGAGTTANPTIWNMASGKSFQVGASTAGQIADLNGNTVTLTGAGTVNFANGITVQSTGGTGTFNVNSGTLSFTGGSSRNTTVSNTITVNVAPGATLNLAPNSGGGSVFNQTTNLNGGTLSTAGGTAVTFGGTLTLGAGSSTITTSPALTLGAIGRTSGGTVNFAIVGALTTTTGTASTILIDSTTGAAYATIGGTDWAAKNSANTAVVGLSTIAGGYTTLTTATFAGALSGNADLTSTAGTYTLTGNSTATSIRSLVSGNTIALGGNSLATGGILSSVTLGISGTGSLTALPTAGGELVLNQTANTATISAPITDGATTTLVKTGAGIVALSGGASNTYSGGTFVNAGTLNFTTGSLGTTGAITMSGGTLQWGTSTTTDLSSRLTLLNGTTASLDTNGNAVVFANAIGGNTTGALSIKAGSAVSTALTLNVANTYSGGTIITPATDNTAVIVANNQALGTGPVTLTGTNTFSGGLVVNTGMIVSNPLTLFPRQVAPRSP